MVQILKMTQAHRAEVLAMMRRFYASPALLTNGSEEIFRADVEGCLADSPYLEGYVFVENQAVVGYAMLAKSFSTEFGKPCVWIEDLYLTPPYRGQGLAARFFAFAEQAHPEAIFRLEVEAENASAIRAYRKSGFDELPYLEMLKLGKEARQ